MYFGCFLFSDFTGRQAAIDVCTQINILHYIVLAKHLPTGISFVVLVKQHVPTKNSHIVSVKQHVRRNLALFLVKPHLPTSISYILLAKAHIPRSISYILLVNLVFPYQLSQEPEKAVELISPQGAKVLGEKIMCFFSC